MRRVERVQAPRSSSGGRHRPEFKDEGIVLRAYKLGESDKILRIMTRGHGKRSAVAKGVRRTSSKWGARLEPLTHSRIFLHEGRGLDTVKQAEIVNSFREVRDDLGLFVRASAMAELIDGLTEDSEPNERLFDMLLLGLQLMRERPETSALDLAMFQFKVMAESGFELMVARCVACGSAERRLCAFSPSLGGLVCERCLSGGSRPTGKTVALGGEAASLLLWMSSHRLGDRPRAGGENALGEAQALIDRALEHLMQRQLRSRKVARRMPRG